MMTQKPARVAVESKEAVKQAVAAAEKQAGHGRYKAPAPAPKKKGRK